MIEPKLPCRSAILFSVVLGAAAASAHPAAERPPSNEVFLENGTLCAFAPLRETPLRNEELLFLQNGTVRIGIDRNKGASITWLSWTGYPRNSVNSSDPGRLIQQSYYAGRSLARLAEGQHKAWSPWSWNPIQGGGVGSWARVTECQRTPSNTLYSVTVPKLWDMANEEAQALMRQWTGFEPGFSNVIVVRCEFVSQRNANDRWGPAVPRHQEIPACYFTRNFAVVKSYLGEGQWRTESQPPGPPWGQAQPPRKAMACFTEHGQGIALFSPAATQSWNFGPHGTKLTDQPTAGPCMHVAPLDLVRLGPQSTYRYRYWLVVGNEAQISTRLDALWNKYSAERAERTEHATKNGERWKMPAQDQVEIPEIEYRFEAGTPYRKPGASGLAAAVQ